MSRSESGFPANREINREYSQKLVFLPIFFCHKALTYGYFPAQFPKIQNREFLGRNRELLGRNREFIAWARAYIREQLVTVRLSQFPFYWSLTGE
jgi:hypothetical protein